MDGTGSLLPPRPRQCEPQADDYKADGARRAVRALLALSANGGYVCAEHYGYKQVMLGSVPPKSEIQLFKGKWGDRCGLRGRPAILKTLKLTNVKFVNPVDYAVLAAGRPRFGTIMRWPAAGSTVKDLVEGQRPTSGLSNLSPPQQESCVANFSDWIVPTSGYRDWLTCFRGLAERCATLISSEWLPTGKCWSLKLPLRNHSPSTSNGRSIVFGITEMVNRFI